MRGLFHDHTMRDRKPTLQQAAKVLGQAIRLVAGLAKLGHVVIELFKLFS